MLHNAAKLCMAGGRTERATALETSMTKDGAMRQTANAQRTTTLLDWEHFQHTAPHTADSTAVDMRTAQPRHGRRRRRGHQTPYVTTHCEAAEATRRRRSRKREPTHSPNSKTTCSMCAASNCLPTPWEARMPRKGDRRQPDTLGGGCTATAACMHGSSTSHCIFQHDNRGAGGH